jgi:hypothetical protein
VGTNASANLGGNGGTGVISSISGAQIQYAGGGGGATANTSSGNGLGVAGGGNGAINNLKQAVNGLANTGGGGGGGIVASTPAADGGSGIVIIRYPSYLAPATSTTGSPETYVTGAWRVYRFVASGTITF